MRIGDVIKNVNNKLSKVTKVIMALVFIIFFILITWPTQGKKEQKVSVFDAKDTTQQVFQARDSSDAVACFEVTESKKSNTYVHKASVFIKNNLVNYETSRFIKNPIYDTFFLMLIILLAYRVLITAIKGYFRNNHLEVLIEDLKEEIKIEMVGEKEFNKNSILGLYIAEKTNADKSHIESIINEKHIEIVDNTNKKIDKLEKENDYKYTEIRKELISLSLKFAVIERHIRNMKEY